MDLPPFDELKLRLRNAGHCFMEAIFCFASTLVMPVPGPLLKISYLAIVIVVFIDRLIAVTANGSIPHRVLL